MQAPRAIERTRTAAEVSRESKQSITRYKQNKTKSQCRSCVRNGAFGYFAAIKKNYFLPNVNPNVNPMTVFWVHLFSPWRGGYRSPAQRQERPSTRGQSLPPLHVDVLVKGILSTGWHRRGPIKRAHPYDCSVFFPFSGKIQGFCNPQYKILGGSPLACGTEENGVRKYSMKYHFIVLTKAVVRILVIIVGIFPGNIFCCRWWNRGGTHVEFRWRGEHNHPPVSSNAQVHATADESLSQTLAPYRHFVFLQLDFQEKDMSASTAGVPRFCAIARVLHGATVDRR